MTLPTSYRRGGTPPWSVMHVSVGEGVRPTPGPGWGDTCSPCLPGEERQRLHSVSVGVGGTVCSHHHRKRRDGEGTEGHDQSHATGGVPSRRACARRPIVVTRMPDYGTDL